MRKKPIRWSTGTPPSAPDPQVLQRVMEGIVNELGDRRMVVMIYLPDIGGPLVSQYGLTPISRPEIIQLLTEALDTIKTGEEYLTEDLH